MPFEFSPSVSAGGGGTPESVGLGNVDNTADVDKIVSIPQQAALDLKADLGLGGTGDVVGPALAGDGKVVLFDGITGKLIKDSGLALSGVNTGDQTLTGLGGVATTRTVNAHALSADVTVTKGDVGLGNVDNTSDATKNTNPVFTGTTLTLANAQDIVINATTGTKIGQATSKIGFYGIAPAVRPTALTQTYSTASATHAAVTQLAAPAGGTGIAAGGWSSAANRDLAIVSINAARTDIANLKNFVNQIVDQLQALGLLQ